MKSVQHFSALLLLLGQMVVSTSCNESNARYQNQQYAWEQMQPLSDSDLLLAHRIDTFFQHKAKRAGLNGAVLVAQHGKILYQKNFGYLQYAGKKSLSDSSSFQLASVSKPFTATAILQLQEKGRLKIDDPVAKYIEQFPYEQITIRHLLNHRSGLLNYIYLFDTMKLDAGTFINNQDVVNYFIRQQPPLQSVPGHHFQYCNTNYALLAHVVELVSGQSFGSYLSENIFKPAHMYHTYLRDVTDTVPNLNQSVAYEGSKWTKVGDVPYDGVAGDKGIYSTTTDLFLFDQALNHGLLLPKELLDEAYKGYSYEKPGRKNYGLGWRLKEMDDSTKIIYHNGWWRGYNTLFVRRPDKETCIIVLANKYNRNVYDIGPLYEILGLNPGDKEEAEE